MIRIIDQYGSPKAASLSAEAPARFPRREGYAPGWITTAKRDIRDFYV
jgi:hypothetical protein